jgi:hypothetical protein
MEDLVSSKEYKVKIKDSIIKKKKKYKSIK